MDFDLFKKVIDETAANLATLHLYNYGEPFMNRRAEDMISYMRAANRRTLIATSTNGILLSNRQRASKVVDSGLSEITFTIGGVNQSAYEKYHKRANLAMAMKGMENVCAAKRELKSETPHVLWRYLTFNWNDSEEELAQAYAISERLGVDRLSFFLTNIPQGCESKRLAPGTPSWRKHRKNIDYAFTYPLPHLAYS